MPNETKRNPWLFFADNDLALPEVAICNIQIAFLESGVLPTKEDAQSYLDFAKSIASIIKNEIYS
jgi:hypothetical protein